MNHQIRGLLIVSAILIFSLIVSTTLIQGFFATSLSQNLWNRRDLYQDVGRYRGSILVEGRPVVKSIPSDPDDVIAFQRVYEQSEMFSAVTGFWSIANRADRGLEFSEDKNLNGDSDSMFWATLRDHLSGKTNVGADVETTISVKVQQAAWDALGDKTGAVVAIEPKTGRILAMVSKPGYDPNALAVHKTKTAGDVYSEIANQANSPLKNMATDELYPPGSSFKVVVSAAALENGFTKESVVEAPKTWQLPGTSTNLPNFHGGTCGGGQQTLVDALKISCNTAFAILGSGLGAEKIREMASRFGYGQSFAIDDAQIGGGRDTLISNTAFAHTPEFRAVASTLASKMTPDRVALAAIGQGDNKITVLQNAVVAATIANGGQMMAPYLVDSLKDRDGKILRQNEPITKGQVLGLGVANQLGLMLQRVVESGTGTAAAVRGQKVAGKTGTAQVGEDQESSIAWFTGFAPVENPEIALCVLVTGDRSRPEEGSFTGGKDAAPIARKVFESAIH